MTRKFPPTYVAEAFRIRGIADRAAELTNRPKAARDVVIRWHTDLSSGIAGKVPSTLGLVSEDLVGIILAAHEAEPDTFAAADAADAAALSAVVAGGLLRPVSTALDRWRVRR